MRALRAKGQFRVRALTRNPGKHPALADKVVAADLARPETLGRAFAGAHGVFLVTDPRGAGNDDHRETTVRGETGPTTGVSAKGWTDTLHTNLTSAFLGAMHQIPELVKQGGGSIIFTSTFVGYSCAFPGVAAYAASKAGLVGLTQALAAEYGPSGVRVNAILPGGVDTPMYQTANNTAESQAFIKNLHALKRVGTPEEVARSALYLASDDSSFVSGTAMLVDGGLSITRT